MKRELVRVRVVAAAGAVVAMLTGALAIVGAGAASAQEPVLISEEVTTQEEATTEEPSCETIDLGLLDSTPGSELAASGRWSTEDCDSRFRSNSDAHTFRFEINATGRIRIDLTSSEADTYLYLLDGEENRITEIDDGSVGRLDSRIERELEAGVYLIEATTTTDRTRGPADFQVAVSVVSTCDPQPLGTLTPGDGLEATGAWSSDSCQSVFLTGHPSQYFVFDLPEGALVQIDLKSPTGDPVLIVAPLVALRTVVPGQVAHNDDVDGTRNSRILRYLPPDTYGIEATTYYGRDLQSPRNEFTLTVAIVEEGAHQARPFLKVEDIDIPVEVVAGDPFSVNYRVGNAGGNGFPDGAGYAWTYTVSRGVFQSSQELSSEHWLDHASFHTNEATASPTSAWTEALTPFSVTFNTPGNTYLFTAVLAFDQNDDELSWHGLWHNLLVKSGHTYGPVEVEIDGVPYSVTATLDENAEAAGTVVTTVTAVDDPEAEVDPETQEKARYAAGVRTQLLDGIFERPDIASLPQAAEPNPVTVPSPQSDALLKTAAGRFAVVVNGSGLLEILANREAINPIAVEDLILSTADRVSETYASLAASWQSLLEQIDAGGALSFADAFAVHSELAYAESILSPALVPSTIVTAARAAEQGWDDPEVQAMLAGQPSCNANPTDLRDAYEAAGVENVDELMALDTELRAASPVYGLLIDGALCAAAATDATNLRFLERLEIDDSGLLLELFAPEEPAEPEEEPEPDPPIELRVMARLGEDGRIEHGVELSSGFQILPERRYLPSESQVGMWYSTLDVELFGTSIGQIRARRLADGRIELGFRDFEGDNLVPDIAYLPADLDEGVWYRSSQIEVPSPPEPEEDEEEAE